MLRNPIVSGQFYPSQKEELTDLLAELFKGIEKTHNAEAVISPHAGYIYSGRIAAHAFSSLKKSNTMLIICPNHTGLGTVCSVYPEGKWKTPLGDLEIDSNLSKSIVEKVSFAEFDELAHLNEHSGEVMLPFIQHLFGQPKIAVICVAFQDLKKSKELGKTLFELSKNNDFSVIASSDFTHFNSLETAKKKDFSAISLIEKMDLNGFHSIVARENLSICGASPIEIAMEYSSNQGISGAELLKYGTSASQTGDKTNVVAYAALAFRKKQ